MSGDFYEISFRKVKEKSEKWGKIAKNGENWEILGEKRQSFPQSVKKVLDIFFFYFVRWE